MLSHYLPAGVPDTPKLYISNNGMATWRQVNSRSPDPVSYILTATTDEGMVLRINIMPTVSGNITQDLSQESLNLQIGEMYRICVTANNTIGYSNMSCVESYTHTGTYIYLHVRTCMYTCTCICTCNDSRKQK